ncbi:hypothetical protein [Granulosicoccus antarcticus]|uniref:Uncharacterized protein n=1 Tax=Granulosicoccus antarcticus IMCC3135 TaxID=1192854 RepID=A0A2Z2NTM6_9GAMM|nr:hypothetical protein [Granulosicoccus antarcticus]ASJ74669.1 hypothetical protein IMCC3135_23000 [Granulosicoccus antarcticus IMCC3135]
MRNSTIPLYLLCTFAILAVMSGCDSTDDSVESPSPTPDLSMITRENYESLVTQAFEIFAGNSFNEPLLALATDDLLDAELVEQWFTYDYLPVEHNRYSCDEGSAEVVREYGEGNEVDSLVNLTYRFDACLDQGIQRNGEAVVYNGRYGQTIKSDALDLYTVPELATSFSGYVSKQTESPHSGPLLVWETRDVEFVTHTVDGQLKLEGMTSRFVASDLTDWAIVSASLEGSFTLRSDATDGRAITVTVTLPFSYSWDQAETPESSEGQLAREDPDAPWSMETDWTSERADSWYFSSGQLELRAEDGSVLLLDANTGVPDTVFVALDNDFESEHFETSWAPWQLLLRLP